MAGLTMSRPARAAIATGASAARAGRRGIRREERFSCYSHLLGAVAALLGTIALVLAARDRTGIALSLIYGTSVTFLFVASTLYHAFKQAEGGQSPWRRLDHVAIFFMIAGSYTPICWVHLQGAWRWSILATEWGMALVGLIVKMLFIRSPRWVTAATYLVMGWVALVPMHRLLASWDAVATSLILGGGVSFSIGAVIYALRRPNPWPGLFGFHDIFHVAVLLGAGLHYVAVFRMVA